MSTFPSDLRLSCQGYAFLKRGPSLKFTGTGTMFLVVAPLVRCASSAVLKSGLDGDGETGKMEIGI